MHITTGLFDHMVLQRNARNVSDATITGTVNSASAKRNGRATSQPVIARVTRAGGRAVPGFARKTVGRAQRHQFTAQLKGLPAGGPYTIELRVGDQRLTVRDVLVGDVWIAAGQSNMQGVGEREHRAKPHRLVRALYMDDHWAVAEDPIHQLEIAVDPVHNGGVRRDKPVIGPKGVGPAVHFAQVMRKRTGVPQGIIACAHGGTSMAQWDPKLKRQGGRSLYGATVRRLRTQGGRVAGVIWYQGESDANADAAPHYTPRMKSLVRAFRRDAGDAALPVVVVQLGRVIRAAGGDEASWNSIQEQQRQLPRHLKHLAVVPAYDLQLDDHIHVGGRGMAVLGARLAYAMDVLRRGRKAGLPPIALRQVKLETNPVTGLSDIVVEFDHVAGRLGTPGDARPTGFDVVASAPPGRVDCIFDTRLEGSRVRLCTTLNLDAFRHYQLHHGLGTNTYCNITDAHGRLLPVLGPVVITPPRACTPLVDRMQVAMVPLPEGVDAKLHGLAHPGPTALAALPWMPRHFPAGFADMHAEIQQHVDEDRLVYYRCRFRVTEPMRVAVLLGYDGPIKAWLDGEPIAHDPDGTNPAREEMRRPRCTLDTGEHDLLVALGTNAGQAWGIFLRFERLDVTRRQLRRGPEAYTLPAITPA